MGRRSGDLGRQSFEKFSTQELNNGLLNAGFVEIIKKKVLSDKTNAFLVAAKPG